MAYTTIDDPSAYFQTALYTGNGGNQSITNDGNSDLQADMIWLKERSSTSYHHIFDSTRGVGSSGKALYPNTSDTEGDDTAFTSFDSDGFTLANTGGFNENTVTNVAWQWKCNGGTESGSFSEVGNNPAVSYSTNQTAGFSIITYTGTGGNGSFAHGLTKAPEYWVVKPRTNVSDNQWFVCHKNINGANTNYANYFIHWDTAGAKQDNNLMWNDTNPDSTSIYLGTKPGTNSDGGSFIAYAWHSVQGYSKFGSYKGNGNADGPFIYTGFKPAYVLTKGADVGDDWVVLDNKRNPNNAVGKRLFPNDNGAESETTGWMDFLSNGFKPRISDTKYNGNGSTYIYAAFAEHPFVSSEGVPTTAR